MSRYLSMGIHAAAIGGFTHCLEETGHNWDMGAIRTRYFQYEFLDFISSYIVDSEPCILCYTGQVDGVV